MCSSETLCTGNSLHGRVLRGTRGEGGVGARSEAMAQEFLRLLCFSAER